MQRQAQLLLMAGICLLVTASGVAASEPDSNVPAARVLDEAPPPIFARGPDGALEPGARAYADRLVAEARTKGAIRVIVGLDSPPALRSLSAAPEDDASRLDQVRQVQDRVLADVIPALRGESRFDVTRFDYIPFVVMNAPPGALQRLIEDQRVTSIARESFAQDALASTVPQIQANFAHSQGFNAAGQTIAIIGTGVDTSHPMLSGRLVSAACYSSAPNGWPGLCSNTTAQVSTAIDSGGPCPQTRVVDGAARTFANCDHETHVASIALGGNVTVNGTSFSGVGRSANLISIQVGSVNFLPQSGYSRTIREGDVIAALSRVFALRTTYSIAAVNLSNTFIDTNGSVQAFTFGCDASFPAMSAAVRNLKLAGIATVAASGNTSLNEQMNAPACLDNVVAVGAVHKTTDPNGVRRASYSNLSQSTDLMAPGGRLGIANASTLMVLAATANGYPEQAGGTVFAPGTTNYLYRDGTSMSAPHVAGAFAILKGRSPTATVDAIEQQLKATGTVVLNTNNVPIQPKLIGLKSSIQTTLTTPSQPAWMNVDPLCFGQNEVWWASSSGTVSHYEVEAGNSSFTSNVRLVATGDAGFTSMIFDSATPAWLRVRACNGLSCSAWRVSNQAAINDPCT
jgi:subtilisin family serine protease